MEDFITQNVLVAMVVSLAMQAWKHSGLPLVSTPTGPKDLLQQRVNRFISVLMAGITALGIHYTFHWDQHTGQFDIAFSGTVASVGLGLWEWVKQWATQHGAYKLVVVMPEVAGDIRTLLQNQQKGQP